MEHCVKEFPEFNAVCSDGLSSASSCDFVSHLVSLHGVTVKGSGVGTLSKGTFLAVTATVLI